MQTVNLKIDGMSCGGCIRGVSTALAAVPGVTVEHVAVGSASVSFEPDTASVEQLISAVARAGFRAVGSSAIVQPTPSRAGGGCNCC